MRWQDRVPACFGIVDVIFADHLSDEDRARQAIAEAKEAGATRDDFEKEMVWHIYKNVTAEGMLQPHIRNQVNKLHQMWKT